MARGGFGGGEGRGGYRATTRDGQELPWTFDPELKIDTGPEPMYPKIAIPNAPKPTATELAEIAHFRAVRSRIHEGPLYTALDRTMSGRIDKYNRNKNDKHRVTAKALFDPFDGMPTYSQKYRRQQRRIPRLDTRPYCLEFFPEELWGTLDPVKYGKQANGATADASILKAQAKRKRLQIARKHCKKSTLEEKLEAFEKHMEENPDEDDDLDLDDAEKEDGDEPEEQQDDNYEDDEDDDDDYNAEQYFDGGDNDYGDDDAGGYGDGGADDDWTG